MLVLAVVASALVLGSVYCWARASSSKLLELFCAESAAGKSTRLLLLVALGLPLIGSIMERISLGHDRPTDFHLNLFTILRIAFLTCLAYIVGRANHRSDQRRREAEKELASAFRQLERQTAMLQHEVARRTTELSQALAYNARLALVAAHTNDAVVITDPSGRIDWVNEGFTRLNGYTLDEARGQNTTTLLVGPSTDQATVRMVTERMAEGHAANAEVIHYAKDGRAYWSDFEVHPFRDSAGAVAGFTGSATDISERKAAEERLLAAKDAAEQLNSQLEEAIAHAQRSAIEANLASQAKSSFLATMSHEIRTPLNGILGMAGLLRDTGINERQMDFVRTIETSGDALLGIINDVLDYSKIEAGRIELENEPFSLRRCVEDVLDMFATKATQKNLELLARIEPDVPGVVMGDVTRVRQVVVNLVGNALKFTAKGEVVLNIAASPPGADGAHVITIGVRDTGIGIPVDRRDRLFQPFSQVDSSTTRKYGGSGLGLAISRRLAEAMGGRMWVDSEDGRGSTFNFTIMAKAQPTTTRHPWEDAPSAFSGRRLLVVDDNAGARDWLVTHLMRWGSTVAAVSSGQEALQFLASGESCDLALIDRQMPEMDGLVLAAEVRKLSARSSMPMVLLNSMADGAARPEFTAQVNKPLKPDRVFAAIDRLFGKAVESQAAANAPAAHEPMVSAASLRVLLVEDNVVNQRVATMLLAKLGVKPLLVNNGQEALDAIAEQPYDFILMDMEMPVMDGCEATRKIRERGDSKRPWIVALTANAMNSDRRRAFDAGMNDFVSKPIRLADLESAFERAAESMEAEAVAAASVA
jgi:PAS domain S-box-containing protein